MRARAVVLLVVLGLLVGCGGSGPATGGSTATGSAGSTAGGSAADGRVRDVVVDSAAVGTPVPVRILVPAGFDAEPQRRWPVLLLLHGCCDSHESWTSYTDLEEFSADLPGLVVMPSGGDVGFYSDWKAGPRWETFHLTELTAYLAREFRASDVRTVAGLSMGGLGALGYAARHPGMFRAVASFSGIAHTRLDAGTSAAYVGLAGEYGADGRDLWGDPAADAGTWAEHNPYDLAPKLAGTPVYLSCGTGRPGPLDGPTAAPDRIEAELYPQNVALARRARAAGVEVTTRFYGAGTHTWPYWQRALHDAWPLLTAPLR